MKYSDADKQREFPNPAGKRYFTSVLMSAFRCRIGYLSTTGIVRLWVLIDWNCSDGRGFQLSTGLGGQFPVPKYITAALANSAWSGATWQWQMCNMWIFKAELSDSEAQQSVNLGAGPGLVSLLIPETAGVFPSLNILLHSQNSGQTDPSLHKTPDFPTKRHNRCEVLLSS